MPVNLVCYKEPAHWFDRERFILLKDLKKIKVKEKTDPTTLYDILKKHHAIIAGGALTSVFSGRRIKDYDIFFYDHNDREETERELREKMKTNEFTTDNAYSFEFSYREDHERKTISVQLIRIEKFTAPPEVIINNFDYTINQCAYEMTEEQFYRMPAFLQHLAERRLVFNPVTDFPISTLFRIPKYLKRGYRISGTEVIRIALKMQATKIETLGDLRKQILGVDTLFLQGLDERLHSEDEKVYEFHDFLKVLDEELQRYYQTGLDDIIENNLGQFDDETPLGQQLDGGNTEEG